MRPRCHHNGLEHQLMVNMNVSDKRREDGRWIDLHDCGAQSGVERMAGCFREHRGRQLKPPGFAYAQQPVRLFGFAFYPRYMFGRVFRRLAASYDGDNNVKARLGEPRYRPSCAKNLIVRMRRDHQSTPKGL